MPDLLTLAEMATSGLISLLFDHSQTLPVITSTAMSALY